MKLLFENWKRYITEVSEAEQSYFGDLPNVAKQIEKAFDKFKMHVDTKYGEITMNTIQAELVFFTSDVAKQTGGKALAIGCGKFRCGFDIGDEYIIKFDISPNGEAREQNMTDAKIGRNSEWNDIFPRSVVSSDDYRWVALERVRVLTNKDMKEFNSFFPNPKLKGHISDLYAYYSLIITALLFNSGDVKLAQDEYSILESKYWALQTKHTGLTLEIVADGFTQHNPHDRIIRAIIEFGIRPEEIRTNNVGVGADGRFVIIDSSVDSQIRKGFGEPAMKSSPKPINIAIGKTQIK